MRIRVGENFFVGEELLQTLEGSCREVGVEAMLLH